MTFEKSLSKVPMRQQLTTSNSLQLLIVSRSLQVRGCFVISLSQFHPLVMMDIVFTNRYLVTQNLIVHTYDNPRQSLACPQIFSCESSPL